MSLIKKLWLFSSGLLASVNRNKLFSGSIILIAILGGMAIQGAINLYEAEIYSVRLNYDLSAIPVSDEPDEPAVSDVVLVEKPIASEATVMRTPVVLDAIPVSKPASVIPVKKKPGPPLKKVTHAKKIQLKKRAKSTHITLAKHKVNHAKAKSIPIPKKPSSSVKAAAIAIQPVHAMPTLPPLKEAHQTVVDGSNIKLETSFHEPKNDLYDAVEPISSTPELVNQGTCKKDKYGYTPLHSAVEQGNKEVVWEWLYQGIPVNVVSNSGYTPLHLAAKHGHIAIIKLLLMKDANLNIRSKSGNTALDLAIAYDQSKVVAYFLNHYNNKVLHYTNQGRSILHVSARHNSKEIIHMLLLDKHLSVDKLDNLDQTPLHIAAKHGRLEALKALIFFNSNLNAQATGGYTPLHLAIQYDQYEVVQELLSKGADAKIITNLKETPLSLAERLGRKEMYALLIKYLIIS